MGFIDRWISNRNNKSEKVIFGKAGAFAQRATQVPNSRRLHVEPLEPRILLSADPFDAKYYDEIRTALAQIGNLVDDLQDTDLFADPLPLVGGAEGATGAGAMSNLGDIFESDILTSLDTLISTIDAEEEAGIDAGSEDSALTGNLADDWQTYFSQIVGEDADASLSITADLDESDQEVGTYTITLHHKMNTDFDISFADDNYDYNVTVGADGELVTTLDTSFKITIDASDDAASDLEFSLLSLSLSGDVDQDLTGEKFILGMTPFIVGGTEGDSSDGGINYDFKIDVEDNGKLDNLTLEQLKSMGSMVSSVEILATEGGTSAVLATLPLSLTTDAASITGLDFTDASFTVEGAALDTEATPEIAATDGLKAISGFNAEEFLTMFSGFADMLENLDGSEIFDVNLPFANDMTVDDAVNLASYLDQIVADLGSVTDYIGFDEAQSATASDASSSVELVSDTIDFSHNPLPANGLSFVLVVDDSQTVTIKLDDTSNITTLAGLVEAVNAALASSTMKDRVSARSDNNKLVFTATKNTDDTPASLSIESVAGATAFNDIVEFAEKTGEMLGHTGTAAELISTLNLRFIDGAYAVDIAYSDAQEYAQDVAFGFDTDLGDLTDVTGTADVKVSSVVGVSATLLFDMNPLGTGGTVDLTTDISSLFAGEGIDTVDGKDDAVVNDLLITLGDGTQIEVNIPTGGTIGDIVSAINDVSDDLTATFNTETGKITVTDSSASATQVSADMGLTLGQTEYPATDEDGTLQSASLTGTVADNADLTGAMKFKLNLSGFPSIVVNLAADSERDTAGELATAIKAALASMSVPENVIGKSGVTYDQLVEASADGSKLTLKTTISDIVDANSKKSTDYALLHAGLRVEAVGFKIEDINGSFAASKLGIAQQKAADATNHAISGSALYDDSVKEHLNVQDATISALTNVTVTNLDATGKVGIIDFSAKGEGHVSLGTSISLANDDGEQSVSYTAFSDAAASDSDTSDNRWGSADYRYFSGTVDTPYASLTLSDVTINSDLLSALETSDITISLNDLESLSDLQNPTADVDLSGLINETTSGLADLNIDAIVDGLNTAISYLNGKFAGSILAKDLPLIGQSAVDITDFGSNFATLITAFQNNPAQGLGDLEAALKEAFGLDSGSDLISVYLTDDASALMLDIDYTPEAIASTGWFSLDVDELAALMADSGVSNDLGNLSTIVDVNNSSALDIAAAASVSLSLGFRLTTPTNTTAASGSTLVNSLNAGKGVATNGSSLADISVTLANGEKYEVDLDDLIDEGTTISDLLESLAHDGVEFTIESDGSIVAVDSTSANADSIPLGLDAFDFVSKSGSTIAADLGGDFDPKAGYDFAISVGGSDAISVHIDADSTRADVEDFVSDLQDSIRKAFVATDGISGISDSVAAYASLSELISVSLSGSELVFEVDANALSSGVITVSDVAATQAHSGLTVKSINGSYVAESLGLAGQVAEGEYTLTGDALVESSNDSRFFIDTENTNVDFEIKITGDDLNFEAPVGAMTIDIIDGTATFGSKDGTGAATIALTLNDEYNGSADDGRLYLSELDHDDMSSLVKITSDAALSTELGIAVQDNELETPLSINVTDYFNTASEREIDISSADMSELFDVSSILNQSGALLSGLDYFLSALEGQLAEQLASLYLPFIGSALTVVTEYFENLHDDIIDAINDAIQDFQDDNPGQLVSTNTIVETALEELFKELGAVSGSNHSQDVGVIVDYDEEDMELSFGLDVYWDFLDTMVDLADDLGIPGLNLEVSNAEQIGFNAAFDIDFEFGLSASDGFFVITDAGDELVLHFDADLSGMSGDVKQGILYSTLTNQAANTSRDGDNPGSSFSGDIVFDINPDQGNDTTQTNASHDARLTFAEINRVDTLSKATMNVDGQLDIYLRGGIDGVLSNIGLPQVSENIQVAFEINDVIDVDNGVDIEYGSLYYKDISLNVAGFINDILLPIVETLDELLDPARDIINFLTTPIPGLSLVLGDYSLLDLAKMNGGDIGGAIKFIETVDQIIDFIDQINEFKDQNGGDTIGFNFSDLEFDGSVLTQDGGVSSVDLYSSQLKSDYRKIEGLEGDDNTKVSTILDEAPEDIATLFTLSILEDPDIIAKLLTSQTQNIDLVIFAMPDPDLKKEFEDRIKFPLYPPYLDFVVRWGGEIGLEFKVTGGYDLTGLVEFVETDNPAYLFDGFYITDLHKNGKDVPEVIFKAEIWGSAGVSFNMGPASVEGGLKLALGAEIGFDLNDPNNDGRFRASEFVALIEISPELLFDIHGELYVEVKVYGRVDVNLVFKEVNIFKIEKDLFPRQVLLSWDWGTPSETILGKVDDSGTLTVNMGASAGDRLVGDVDDGDEEFVITHVSTASDGTETVEITFNGITQKFTGVDYIQIDGGKGNDTIILSGITSDMYIDGGAGDDIIRLDGVGAGGALSTGNAQIRGGTGKDTIYGGSGADDIFGENGDDTIYGGAGNDVIEGGVGDDVIYGDAGNDTIHGNEGNDLIYGGAGNDSLFGEQGLDMLVGDAGNDYLDGGRGSDRLYGDTTSSAFNGLTLVSDSSEGGDDTLIGGRGDDYMFGGAGNDRLDGDRGNDIMFGDTGKITLSDNGLVIRAETLSSSASIGGDDVISGGQNEDTIFGGVGNDTISGGNNIDILIGDTGLVDGAAGALSNGRFRVMGNTDASGDDTITGGSGDDFIIGGLGSDNLSGERGRDVIGGDVISVVREQTTSLLGLISVETTSESEGSADSIEGGMGTDIMLGGAGADTINGGTGSDVILGDHGMIKPGAVGLAATIVGRNTENGGNDVINAGSGYDVVVAGMGNDTITGGEGNDTLLGDLGEVERDKIARIVKAQTSEESFGGNDLITGDEDNDVIFGGAGSDDLQGGVGNDVILGDLGIVIPATGEEADIIGRNFANGGRDAISGGDGDDVLIGGGGDDTITGGDGTNYIAGDNAELTRSVYTVDEDTDDPLNELAAAPVLIFETNEETLGGDDIITGGANRDIVLGGSGKDTITTFDVANTADVSNGNDIVIGDNGIIIPVGSDGADIRSRTKDSGDNDVINVGNGNNIVMGAAGDDTITSGSGNDYISGDFAELTRGENGDLISFETTDQSTGGNDSISAGAGDDLILGGTGADSISGGAGNDTILGDLGIVVPVGSNGPDVIARDGDIGGADTIEGNDGNDVILGGALGDTIASGTGNDYVAGDIAELKRDENGDLVSFETVEQNLGGDDSISAGDGNDFILGGTGADSISGGAGNDTILGDLGIVVPVGSNGPDVIARNGDIGGADTIEGNDGNDVILGGALGDTIASGTGNDYVAGDIAELKRDENGDLVSFETVEQNLGGDDSISAGDGNDFILGGTGADSISGGAGNDTILGDLGIVVPVGSNGPDVIARNGDIGGADTIEGNDGDDVILGGALGDTIRGGAGNDYVAGDLAKLTRLSNGTLVVFETAEEAIGGDDLIHGGDGNDIIFGGEGSDYITGGKGEDSILGDVGSLTYNNDDIFVKAEGSTINLGNHFTLASRNSAVGTGDTIFGNEGNDLIIGASGNDYLDADEGDDAVIGDQGTATYFTLSNRIELRTTELAQRLTAKMLFMVIAATMNCLVARLRTKYTAAMMMTF